MQIPGNIKTENRTPEASTGSSPIGPFQSSASPDGTEPGMARLDRAVDSDSSREGAASCLQVGNTLTEGAKGQTPNLPPTHQLF